jgi:hypothetical protein
MPELAYFLSGTSPHSVIFEEVRVAPSTRKYNAELVF